MFLKKNKIFKFKSSVLFKLKKKLKIEEVSIKTIQDHQVLIKIKYTSICRSQIMEIDGLRGRDKFLPHLLGHEASGTVVTLGKKVKKFKIGDKVIAGWIQTNQKKYKGFKLDIFNKNKKVNSGPITTFGNYSLIYENRLVKKPNNLTMREATLYGCALPTGAGMVINQVRPKKNDSVLVLGLGAIGLSAVAALQCMGVKNIVAVDYNNERLRLAKKLGANYLLNSKNNNFEKNLKVLFPKGFDKCIESAGKTKTIEFGFSCIKDKVGKLYFASHPDNKSLIKLKPHDLIRGRKIYGSWGGNCNPEKDIPRIFRLFKKNNVNLKCLLSKNYNLNDINSAINDFKKGKVIRPIIKI